MGLIASGGVTSGMLGRNSIQPENLVSGSPVQLTAPIFSGGPNAPITAEVISGGRAVRIDASGQIQIAMASVSGRMPAMGIARDNYLSGVACTVLTGGYVQFASGMADFSGGTGSRLFVGRSGQVVLISGSWTSGAFGSGDLGQVIGVVQNSGGMVFDLGSPDYRSGGPMAWNVMGFDK